MPSEMLSVSIGLSLDLLEVTSSKRNIFFNKSEDHGRNGIF